MLMAMASSTVEDYVKAIYHLQRDSASGEATVVRLSATLGVTKGSVTAMVRKLREAGLADAQRYGGIRLTAKGERVALDMIRRHRLIEVFLVDTLGLDWAEVHDEAERLEHAMSAKVLDRLDAFLGNPTNDPHGDPIPTAAGELVESAVVPLPELGKGEAGAVARVDEQDRDFLAFAAASGLRPGAAVRVVDRVEAAESMRVKAEGKATVSLSFRVARQVMVSRSEG